jgi:ABC-type Mn2+/Zn2+ transport system permease subunit
MQASQTYALLLALLFAVTAGLVGCFALMKRMLLASDVISHLALPGLGIAFLLKFNPLVGGAATLFLGTLLIWRLQRKTGLATEAMVGVVFAAAVAIGAAVTPREDLVEALFGSFQKLSLPSFLLGLAASAVVVFFVFRLKDQLVLSLFSPEIAASTGVNVSRLELYFLLLFSLVVLVGLRYMGALLTSALIIMPAAIARQLTDRVTSFLVVSSAASVVSVMAGYLFSTFVWNAATPSPAIVIASTVMFVLSMAKRPA